MTSSRTESLELRTLPEAADQLRVSRRTVERLIAAGRIRVTRVGGRTLITQRELEVFISASTVRRVA